ncbi:MAG: excinuclease ABC subunit UvrC [Chloroflexi bacterium]|nr:excinuclease ABC subunit UvrC [Chloroflexota bacterium]MCC6896671.1 excinuclease ABC subunit UvrC [Anaerolineae bacterium]
MSFKPSEHIANILSSLPMKPGCYLMKDKDGKIIYVGKAKRLRNRVRSYFNSSAETNAKTLRLRENIMDIEIIITETEVQALITEETLIKRHMPFYNISLKDDKHYPYIKINWQDPFPKVETTRRVLKDGSRYFGPYAAMWAVQNTLRTLRRAFPYLTCDRVITGHDERPCLFYDIKLCNGPCIGAVNKEQYREMISELMDVLSGKSEPVVKRITKEMQEAAEALNFEKAGVLRDQLKAIEYITQRHKAVNPDMTDHDVIALARDKNDAAVQILFIRNGKLVGSDTRMLTGAEGEPDAEVLEQFLTQFYSEAAEIPKEIMLPSEIEGARIVEQWLRDKRRGQKVTITVPQRGNKRDLIKMAQENATEGLRMIREQWEADTHKQEQSLTSLQEELGLENPPNRIECFDISTTQGTAIVAARVVFVQGAPRKSEYRRFNIKTVTHSGPDDYQSMREALTRRFNRWKGTMDDPTQIAPGADDHDETWRLLPDLLIIDGGKGQLGIAVEVLTEFGLMGRVPVVGLAKQFEEIFFPNNSTPLVLNRRSPALYLMQRVRDEAHRYGITTHRNQRTKLGLMSRLEAIPGIGPQRRKALLKAFGNSIDAVKNATVEDLMTVKGVTAEIATSLKELL